MTEDYYFWSHRLPIAKAAQKAGFEVFVATHIHSYSEDLRREGFIVYPALFSRSNTNLWIQFKALLELIQIFRQVQPNIVHNVALKAIVFGSIAAWVARVPRVINLIAGFGSVFTGDSIKYRYFARMLLQRKGSVVMTQNLDDAHEIKQMAPGASVRLIRGSGVDTELFSLVPEPEGPIRVALVGRMLWNKGVGEFVEASRWLQSWGENIKMVLVGGLDFGNPASISRRQLDEWQLTGLVSWIGHQQDIRKIWAQSHIAVLPSYREGLPKSLLEAAASGRPIVAADTPGCRKLSDMIIMAS